jgi:hypothetical protein
MSLPKLLSNRQFQEVTAAAGISALIYLIINLFVIGGDEFVFQLNSFLVSPLSIVTVVMAMLLWRQMKIGVQSRFIWSGLLAGWMCWAIAELLWATYSLLGQDPFPSPADIFFLAGYIPLAIGFLSRLSKLPQRPDKTQRVLIGTISLVVGGATIIYILLPILQSYDPGLFLENLLSIFYPLADLVLLLLVVRLLFTYGPGIYGMAWRLILIGFITVTVSDLFFSYADWNGLYYPDARATLMSTIGVDWMYNLSYLLWAFGIYTLRELLGEHHTRTSNFQPKLVPNTYILLFTDKDKRVSDVSPNYYPLFPVRELKRKSLVDILGISEQQEHHIHDKLLTEKKYSEELIHVTGSDGIVYEARISGLAIMPSPNQFDGAILLLRLFAQPGETTHGLSEYHKTLVWNILKKVDNNEKKEISSFLRDYYLAYITSLFNLALREGGAPMSQSFLDELHTVSRKNGWGMIFDAHMKWDSNPAAYLEAPNHAWRTMLETAKQFTSQLTDTATVEACMQDVRIQFSDEVLETAARFDGLISPHART